MARRLIGELAVDSPTAGVLELLTSELVSNAVRHGPAGEDDQQISLAARLADGHVFVEVCDEGSDVEPILVQNDDPLEPGGLGLQLVDSLAADWGSRHDGMCCVWFRLAHA